MAKKSANEKDIIKEPKVTSRDILIKLRNEINKHYERKVVMMGDERLTLPKIKTGVFPFDVETEGGLPRGRTVIFVGEESSFKSTLMYIAAGKFQHICGNCMLGNITQTNFKKVEVPFQVEKSTDVVEKGKDGHFYSKLYLADKNKLNVYCPGELLTHKKNLTLLSYELECDVCTQPEYSIFVLVDAERNYTKNWARRWGVVHHYTMLSDTNNSQMTGDIMREALSTGKVSFLGIDSVDAAGAKEEDENSVEDWQMGLQARIWNKITRIITSKLNTTFIYKYTNHNKEIIEDERHSDPTICLIQQWREKIGGYGNPLVVGGGRGKNYASSTTVETAIGEKVWVMTGGANSKKDYVKGIYFPFHLRKQKTGRPYRSGKFFYDTVNMVLDDAGGVFDYAVKYNIIEKGGAWFTYGDEKFQGEEKMRKWLNDNPKELDKIKTKILAELNQ